MCHMTKGDKQLEKVMLELRRGTLVLSVLSQLHTPQYGYSLMQALTAQGLDIDQGTLYPLLRRLEKQDLLESEWVTDGSRPRRYYTLSKTGKVVLEALTAEWHHMVDVTNRLLSQGA